MTPTEIIKTVGPEFSTVRSDDLDKWVELTRPLVSKAKFGELYDQAVALLTCHRMKMAGLGDSEFAGTVGDTLRVGNYSEGNRSIGYVAPQGGVADTELLLTGYGIQYMTLRNSVVVPITISPGGR